MVIGIIVVVLVVIAGLLWDIAGSLHRLEDVLPAAKKWLDDVERKERSERESARYMQEMMDEQQRKETEKMREETPGCRETMRGGGLRRILPGEPDYQYTVPLGDSTKAHFVTLQRGFREYAKGTWILRVCENPSARPADFRLARALPRGC